MNAREKILKAADELFGSSGFDATTTREIAERSGVNKALIHYHFKSKDFLLEHLLDLYFERLSDTLGKALQGPDPLRDRMMSMVDAYVDFLDKNRNFHRIVQREASGGKHMDRVRNRMLPLFDLCIELIKQGYPFTRSGELEAAQLLISFYGMIISYFTYSRVLEPLLKTDPLSKQSVSMRKRHLRRMVGITFDVVEKLESTQKVDRALKQKKP